MQVKPRLEQAKRRTESMRPTLEAFTEQQDSLQLADSLIGQQWNVQSAYKAFKEHAQVRDHDLCSV